MTDTSREITIIQRQASPQLEENAVHALANFVLDACHVPPGKGINIMCVDDECIRSFNTQYLDRDSATDVISFPIDNEPALPEEDTSIGDIIISVETCHRYAEENGIDFTEELIRYIIHGILHCLGYEDTDVESKKIMEAQQEKLVAEWYRTQETDKLISNVPSSL